MSFPIANELFPTSNQVVSDATLNRLVSKVALISYSTPCLRECEAKFIECIKTGTEQFCYAELRKCDSTCLNLRKKIVDPISTLQLDITNPNLPVFKLEILDDTIIGDLILDIPDLSDYSSTLEGFVIRGTDNKCPNISIKLILTNPVRDDELFRLQLIIRDTKIGRDCKRCNKDLINIELIGQK